MRFFIILFSSLLLVSACTTEVVLDNPTGQTFLVNIDEQAYTLSPLKSQKVTLKEKSVQIIVKDTAENEIVNEAVQISGEGIINPTLSLYVIQKDVYCSLKDYEKYKEKLNLKESVLVNEKEYENVDFTLENRLFISKNWDYGLSEAFPKDIVVSDFQLVSKIFRIDALEKSFGFMGELDFSNYTQEEMDFLLDSLNNMKNDSL